MKKLYASLLLISLVLLCACNGEPNYRALLAENSDFDRPDAAEIFYDYGGGEDEAAQLAALDEAWHLRETAGEGTTFERSLRLMHWLRSHTEKVSNGRFVGSTNAAELLAYAYDQPRNGLVCREYSVALSECLLAVGIQARVLYMYPAVWDGDNHVVVRVWLPEEDRCVLLDPSFDHYVTDEAGRVLDAPEIRKNLEQTISMQISESTTWEGGNESYFDYLAKNMFYFQARQNARYGMAETGTVFYLLPVGSTAQGNVTYATYESFWQ